MPLSLLAGVLRAIASYLHWADARQRQRCSMISDVLCHAVVGTPDFQPPIPRTDFSSCSVCAHPTITCADDAVPASGGFKPSGAARVVKCPLEMGGEGPFVLPTIQLLGHLLTQSPSFPVPFTQIIL